LEIADVAAMPPELGADEAGMVVKIVEGPALVGVVLEILPCQHLPDDGTYDSRTVVEGEGPPFPLDNVEDAARDPLSPVEDASNPVVLLSLVDTALGARSPKIPSRKGKVPDLADPVETGSKREIDDGTDIVEKIPASLSSAVSASASKDEVEGEVEGENGTCSPARLILLFWDRWGSEKNAQHLMIWYLVILRSG
jgi:hypothetical protein